MTNRALKITLDRLGLMQSEFARLIEVSPRTVSLWATGDAALPGPVAAYLRVLEALPPDGLATELRRVQGRKKMIDDGLYALSYAADGAPEPRGGENALAVLRNGNILGSDRWGGLFTGSYEFDPVMEVNKVHVRLQVPPDGQLITGFAAGPEGAVIDIAGDFERAAPVSRSVVDVAGHPVEVQLTYLGPLPS